MPFHEHLAAQSITNDDPQHAPSDPAEELIGQLNAVGDEARLFHRELLDENRPAARVLEALLQLVFEHLNIAFMSLLSGGGRSQRHGRAALMQVALQATVNELTVQRGEGVHLSVRHVRVSFQARFEERLGLFDPLVLDLNRNGLFDVTTPQDGHEFDATGTGRIVQAATVTAGDGFLVLDRNHNGQIDDGRELFGDQHGAADGFAELARFDANHDKRIDALDPIFGELGIFEDRDRNGRSDPGELRRLAELHITRIGLERRPAHESANGNPVALVGTFYRDDGSQGRVGDLQLNYVT